MFIITNEQLYDIVLKPYTKTLDHNHAHVRLCGVP
jgi:hypothetical protein